MGRRHGRSGRAAASAAAAATAILVARPARNDAAAWSLAGGGCSRAARGVRRGDLIQRNNFLESWQQQGLDWSNLLPAFRELLGSPERSLRKELEEYKVALRESRVELSESRQRETMATRQLLNVMTEEKELNAAYQFACASYESASDELEMMEVLEHELRDKIEALQIREADLEVAYWDAGEELEELRPLREERTRLAEKLEASESKKKELELHLAGMEDCKAGLQERVIKLSNDLADRTEQLVMAQKNEQLLREENAEGAKRGEELEALLQEMIDEYKVLREAKERRLTEEEEEELGLEAELAREGQDEAKLRDKLDAAWELPEQAAVPAPGGALPGQTAP